MNSMCNMNRSNPNEFFCTFLFVYRKLSLRTRLYRLQCFSLHNPCIFKGIENFNVMKFYVWCPLISFCKKSCALFFFIKIGSRKLCVLPKLMIFLWEPYFQLYVLCRSKWKSSPEVGLQFNADVIISMKI